MSVAAWRADPGSPTGAGTDADSPVVSDPVRPPTLRGHFAVFNQWTEIKSSFEGHFLERFSPGAFARTLAADRSTIKALFQHGRDPQIGDKPLGIPTVLREDEQGAYFEVPLFDTSYNNELLPGLRAGAYGMSFRFKPVREDFDTTRTVSAYNPAGLPERTVREARVMELSAVTFPAYEGADVGVRSSTGARAALREVAA